MIEHLDIKGAKNKIQQIDDELCYLKEKKKINFEKTQPKSPVYREVIEGKSDTFNISDKYSHFIIKDIEIDKQIIALEKEKIALDTFILNEVERLSKYDEIGLMEYYRDKGKSWRQIDMILHRADGYSRLKYFRAKKSNDNK